jgi:DNA-binding LacI/PurR family transcriptional regulator
LIPSDRRKRVTTKDVAQEAGGSTQTVSRVMNMFSSVFGKAHQCMETVVEQYGIPSSSYFYLFLMTISQYLQLLGGQAVQNVVEMIRVWLENKSVIAPSMFTQPNPGCS